MMNFDQLRRLAEPLRELPDFDDELAKVAFWLHGLAGYDDAERLKIIDDKLASLTATIGVVIADMNLDALPTLAAFSARARISLMP